MTGRGRPPIGPPVTIRLDPELKRALETYARTEGFTLAELVRSILYQWTDNEM